MDSYVKASFWSDERVENLPPEQKLSLLWLVTNPQRDLLGFTQVTTRRFCFETGLTDLTPLQGACKALPTSFILVQPHLYFCRNFLRHQFGKGGKISLKNNVIRAVIRHARTLPSPLQGAFLEAYPELAEFVLEVPQNPPQNEPPSNPLPRGREEKSRVEKSRVEKIEEGYGEKPDLPGIVASYPKRQDVAQALEHLQTSIRKGADPAVILAGTRAIAAVILHLPSGALNGYVPSAGTFFKNERWRDDPQTWQRGAAKTGAIQTPLNLGGRKAGETIRA